MGCGAAAEGISGPDGFASAGDALCPIAGDGPSSARAIAGTAHNVRPITRHASRFIADSSHHARLSKSRSQKTHPAFRKIRTLSFGCRIELIHRANRMRGFDDA
jgi:hypothetical protein